MFRLTSCLVASVVLWGTETVTHAFADQLVLDQFCFQSPDQTSWSDFAVYNSRGWAQTFTVGIDGRLSRIDIFVSKSAGDSGPAKFTLRPSTSSGAPDPSRTLFSTFIDVETLPDATNASDPLPPTTIDVSEINLNVGVGEVYAIALERIAPTGKPWLLWSTGEPADPYDRGTIFHRPYAENAVWTESFPGLAIDMEFATYVTIPEPSTLVLLAMGAVGLLAYAWRRRR